MSEEHKFHFYIEAIEKTTSWAAYEVGSIIYIDRNHIKLTITANNKNEAIKKARLAVGEPKEKCVWFFDVHSVVEAS